MSLDEDHHRNYSASLRDGHGTYSWNCWLPLWSQFQWSVNCLLVFLDGHRHAPSVPNWWPGRPTTTSMAPCRYRPICCCPTNDDRDCGCDRPLWLEAQQNSNRRRKNNWNRHSNSEPKWWSNGRPSGRDRNEPLNEDNQSIDARWRKRLAMDLVGHRWPWPLAGIASCNGPPCNHYLQLHRSTWLNSRKNKKKYWNQMNRQSHCEGGRDKKVEQRQVPLFFFSSSSCTARKHNRRWDFQHSGLPFLPRRLR